MPETVFSHHSVSPASPGRVWERLQDPAVWATVAGVDRTTDHVHDGGDLQAFRFETSIGGGRYRGEARVTIARPEEEMSLSIRSHQLTGQITVSLQRHGDGTRLEVVMRMRPNGLVGSMVFPLVTGAVSNGFDHSVERLAGAMP